MNIIPPTYNQNAPVAFAHSAIQNDRTLHLSKQSKTSTSSNSSKGDDEREHIRELSKRLPGLTNIFNLHHKIGEGSFSSVFLASLKYHDHLPRDQRKLFAIKHLVPTSHPSRIEQELRCLKYIGGCDNVVGLDFCMRKYDTVIFVMPYLPHSKFSEYVLKMDVQETKLYVKNLLLALRRVHQFNIIHRDVKPSNFLYDRINGRFLLVDFGLAQKMDSWPTSNSVAQGNPSTNNTLSAVDNNDSHIHSSNSNSVLTSNAITTSTNTAVGTIKHDLPNTDTAGKKRKLDELNDGEVKLNELEPNPKRVQLQQPNTGVECTPLKPLQDDHPKITPTVELAPPPQRSQSVAPKLATVKRQMFVDNENKTKGDVMANTTNKRMENVYNNLTYVHNNYMTSNGVAPYTNGYYPSPYSISNYPVVGNSLDYAKLSHYYNNMLLNNIIMSEKCNAYYYKSSIHYQYYKNQLMQSPYAMYNQMYTNSKLDLLSKGRQQHSVVTNAASNAKVGNSKSNVLTKLERGVVDSKQVSVKHEALKREGRSVGGVMKVCGCGGKPAVCSVCLGKGAYNAPRAGTQGFRPPEVLLKYTEQTTAVDVWACGVILLSIVSGCYPFFRAPDDLTALAEMVTIFGTKPLKEVATILGRHLICSHMKKPLDLRKLCSHLRYRALKSNSAGSSDLVKTTVDHLQDDQNNKTDHTNGCQISSNTSASANSSNVSSGRGRRGKKNCEGCRLPADSCVCASEESHKNSFMDKGSRTWCGFPEETFDLLERLLDLNPHTRITATEALNHPFLANL